MGCQTVIKDEFDRWFYDLLKRRGGREHYSRRSTEYNLARKAYDEFTTNPTKSGHKDYGLVVLCAIRYCFGRMTYMPDIVIDYVKEHWADLKQRDQDIILRDVGEELVREDRSPGWLGYEVDVQKWRDFHWWILERKRLDEMVT